MGVVHGDVFPNNTKWQNGHCTAIFDWEMAAFGPLVYDVAIAINAHCWQADEKAGQPGFDLLKAQSLLSAYVLKRPVTKADLTLLPLYLKLSTLRFTLARLIDFELMSPSENTTTHLDYRDFFKRLLFWDDFHFTTSKSQSEAKAHSFFKMP